MEPNQYWAAILSDKSFNRILDDPHPASAAVVVDNTTFCSTVLPWWSVKEDECPRKRLHHSKASEACSFIQKYKSGPIWEQPRGLLLPKSRILCEDLCRNKQWIRSSMGRGYGLLHFRSKYPGSVLNQKFVS